MPDGSYSADYPQSTMDVGVTQRWRGKPVRATVAENFDDLVRARVIRGAVWLCQEGARYDVQFDRNDTCSTHLLAWVGDEPVGTMRIRWLPDQARFERLAVRPEFRSMTVFRALAKFAFALCAAKGYRTVTSVALEDTIRLWERLGAKVNGEALLLQVDKCVVPMKRDLPAAAHPALAGGAGTLDFELAMVMAEADLMRSSSEVSA
ncbi:GNAT family N-acetyltransferase [Azospirillum sp.]|uniref:GNAT family N-acetyltransferase n=1 Tax=Azospirillum sp. TaxID=34012 RepID=UPI002D34413F|nr:GNAT family N-acetyltransferase [Azospirillum sp.]HYD68056.1 GNAT family N-acetyltransferase [Azospirillum sp.]